MAAFKNISILLLFSRVILADPISYIEIGGMAISQKSNTEPLLFHEEKRLSSLENGPIVQKEVDPYLSFQFINNFHGLQSTMTLDDTDKLSLRMEDDTLGAEVFIRPSYEFKNPYQLYTKRTTTLVMESGAGVIYKNSSSLEFSYMLSYKDVLDDEIGKQMQSFQRSGYIHRVEGSWKNDYFKLTTGGFLSQNMGNTENYKGADIQLSSAYTIDKIQLYGAAALARRKYEGSNPFFNTVRNQHSLKASFSLEYDFSPVGYYSIIGVMLNRQYSNITFFNESINALFIGIGKNF